MWILRLGGSKSKGCKKQQQFESRNSVAAVFAGNKGRCTHTCPIHPRLESLPEEIGELPALVRLNVSTNALRTLPASMGRLRKIQRIDAANNMLVGGRGFSWQISLEGCCLQLQMCSKGHGSRRCYVQHRLRHSHFAVVQVRVPPSMGYLKTIKELNLR